MSNTRDLLTRAMNAITALDRGWDYSDLLADIDAALAKTDDPKRVAAIKELMVSQELSESQVMIQALRFYQVHCRRIQAGEVCSYSGDLARAAEFAGKDLPNPPVQS